MLNQLKKNLNFGAGVYSALLPTTLMVPFSG